MRAEGLLSISNVARFLGATERTVIQLLEEGRLGGVMLAALRHKGVHVTPSIKNAVDMIVHSLKPKEAAPTNGVDRAYLLASESTITIMFTDIVGSTPLMERLGDARAREIVRGHNQIIRNQIKAHGGVEVKSMGDGFMLTFQSASRGVACAIAIQKDLAQYNMGHPDTPIVVRMGLSMGEPIREEEDLFGKSVILAARISATAYGGQILTCQLVHALVGHSGVFGFGKVGDFELKGISGIHPLYEVNWRQ